MNADNLIQTIIDRRRELGLSQEELGRRTDISRRTIIAMESGANDIGLRRFLRILQALDLSVAVKPGADRPTESELQDIFREDDE